MEHDALIRLGVFLGLFAVFSLIEWYHPRRTRVMSQSRRWLVNLSVSVIDTLALRLFAIAVPLLAVGAAIDAGARGWGLLNHIALPGWLAVVLTVLIFDLAIWAQHLVTHKVPVLWRIHRVHHSDRDMDVTTALRFHPVEILMSMGLKIGLVYVIGPPALGVLLFEVLLNGTAMFNHANLRLPLWLDRWLRRVLVTPDMHLVHHSVHRDEHDSNYGFALSVWDRLFGTYIAAPREGLESMIVGLHWQDQRPAQLSWVLRLPFRRG